MQTSKGLYSFPENVVSTKTKKQQSLITKNTASLAKATSIDLTKSLSALGTAGVAIQSTLGKIQEELITKHAELQAIDEAIALKTIELEGLHSKDQILLTIDELKAQHQQTIAELQAAREVALKDNADLEAQLEQERKREQDAFSYKLAQDRKADTDNWNEQIRVRTNSERDRREAFEKDIANRELVLKTKENDYQAALTKAATFEDEVKKAAAREVAIVTSALTKDFKHQTEITAVQNASALEKQKHDNVRLVEALNNLETANKELQAQLKDAYAKNAELAKAAVDGAANSKAQADALTLMTNIGGGNGTSRPRS